MTSISHYPHSLNTKYYAVLLYRNGNPISFVCRRYKCSKASLMRWNKKFDGTKESLMDKSHKLFLLTLMLILKKNLLGLKIILEEILLFLFVNYMVNYVLKKVILDMPVPYLELFESLNILLILNLILNIFLKNMILLPI